MSPCGGSTSCRPRRTSTRRVIGAEPSPCASRPKDTDTVTDPRVRPLARSSGRSERTALARRCRADLVGSAGHIVRGWPEERHHVRYAGKFAPVGAGDERCHRLGGQRSNGATIVESVVVTPAVAKHDLRPAGGRPHEQDDGGVAVGDLRRTRRRIVGAAAEWGLRDLADRLAGAAPSRRSAETSRGVKPSAPPSWNMQADTVDTSTPSADSTRGLNC